MTRTVALVLAVVLLGAAAGCGDGDGDPELDRGSGPDATTEPTGDRGEPPRVPDEVVQPTDVAGLDLGLAPTELEAPVEWAVTVYNTTGEPVTLEFSSGLRADLRLLDEADEVVYRWSDGRAFTAALGEEEVPAGGSATFTLEADDLDVAAGTYDAIVSVPAAEPLAAVFTVELT